MSRDPEADRADWDVKSKVKGGPELNGTGDARLCMPCAEPRLYSRGR